MLYFGFYQTTAPSAPLLIWCHDFCICHEISISEVVPRNVITHIFKSIDCILKDVFYTVILLVLSSRML